MLKKNAFGIIYALVLTAFTAYILLDAFVIPRKYKVVTSPDSIVSSSSQTSNLTEQSASEEVSQNSESDSNNSINSITESQNQLESNNSPSQSSSDNSVTTVPSISDHSYDDGKIKIALNTCRQYNTDIYVADIVLSDIRYLKTAFANDTYGKNITQKTSVIAENHGAILAINGDYYSARNGFVLRNGELYRESSSSSDSLLIDKDGSFSIMNGSSDISSIKDKAWQILSFGPTLINNSDICVDTNDEVSKAMSSNPRTAIGIIDTLHYVMIVSDGRTNQSSGLSLYQLAEFMNSLNVKTAYNLDGGGSSTMYFNGKVVNNPTTNGNKISERSVSDIVYIG